MFSAPQMPNALPAWVASPPPATQRARERCVRLSLALGEPLAETQRLVRRNRRFLAAVENMRHAEQPAPRLKRYFSRVHCDSSAAYQGLLHADPRSRILVSFHFGDFLFGFYRLLAEQAYLPKSRMLLLAERPASAGMLANFSILFPRSRFLQDNLLPLDQATPRRLLSFLRQPGATLITFFDLPPGYGRSSRQKLFARPAQLSLGPAVLSRLAGAPLLPVVTTKEGDSVSVRLVQQLEPAAQSAEAITGELALLLERTILDAPEQWRYLQRLDEFMSVPH